MEEEGERRDKEKRRAYVAEGRRRLGGKRRREWLVEGERVER